MNNQEVDTVKFKEIFDTVLGNKVHSSQLNNFVKNTFGEELTHAELIVIGQILKAENERDTRAAEFIRNTMGQKPTDKKEISGTKENPFVIHMDPILEELSQ